MQKILLCRETATWCKTKTCYIMNYKPKRGAEMENENVIKSHEYGVRGAEKLNAQDYIGALEDFNKAIELNSENHSAYNDRGIAKESLKNYQGAIEDYNKAIELGQNIPSYYHNRALYKMDIINDYQSAIEDFNKAIELDPNDANYYVCRGQALMECAGVDFHKALKMEPNNEEAIFFAGLIDEMHGVV